MAQLVYFLNLVRERAGMLMSEMEAVECFRGMFTSSEGGKPNRRCIYKMC